MSGARQRAADEPDFEGYRFQRWVEDCYRRGVCCRRERPALGVDKCWCWKAGPGGATLPCPPFGSLDGGTSPAPTEQEYADICCGWAGVLT